jgi:hypothetical protein
VLNFLVVQYGDGVAISNIDHLTQEYFSAKVQRKNEREQSYDMSNGFGQMAHYPQ